MNIPSKTFKLTPLLLVLGVALAFGASSPAQDGPLKVEELKEAAPEALEASLKEVLAPAGLRVLDGQDEPFVDLWIRKDVPAKKAPSGPEGAVLFPVFDVGQYVGVIRVNKEAYDYRDQPIAPGLFTLRYGLQPINGDHLGVSTYRDYLMLVPVEQEADLELIEQDTLDILSADAAMTNHPAVFLLVAPPAGDGDAPGVGHDEEKDQWGAVFSVPLKVAGQEGKTSALKVQLILVGRGPV